MTEPSPEFLYSYSFIESVPYHETGENSHFHCRKYTQEFLREVVNSFMVFIACLRQETALSALS